MVLINTTLKKMMATMNINDILYAQFSKFLFNCNLIGKTKFTNVCYEVFSLHSMVTKEYLSALQRLIRENSLSISHQIHTFGDLYETIFIIRISNLEIDARNDRIEKIVWRGDRSDM